MKIVSHRGAAGLALENSIEAIRCAQEYNIDGIELDVRFTKDGHPVLMHNADTAEVADTKVTVRQTSLTELKDVRLKNGERIPTLKEALDAIDPKLHIFLDMKETSTVRTLL